MRKLEVIRFRRTQPAGYGYVGTEEVDVQQLGYYRLGRWVPVDEEIIPNWAVIYMGAYGDSGGWRSKFVNWIPKAQYGKAEDFA